MDLNKEKLSLYIILFLSLFILGLFLYLLLPFLSVMAWAGILAFFFYPLYQRLNRLFKGRKILAAGTLLILIILFLLPPLFLLILQIIYQAEDLMNSLNQNLLQAWLNQAYDLLNHPLLAKLLAKVELNFDTFQAKIYEQLSKLLESTFSILKNFLQATFKIVFKVVLTLFTLFYFLADGDRLVEVIKKLIPGSAEKKEEIISRVSFILKAVLYGSLLTAIVQGALATLIYFLFGVHSYLLLGVLTGIASFIPVLGTTLIWIPVGLYIALTSGLLKGILFLLICALTVAQIDNLLKPFFIGGRAKLHNLLVFFSVLGGIISFGFLGLFLGPMILGLFLSVLDIYQTILNSQEETNSKLD